DGREGAVFAGRVREHAHGENPVRYVHMAGGPTVEWASRWSQPRSRRLTRQRQACCRRRMRVLGAFMAQILGRDGFCGNRMRKIAINCLFLSLWRGCVALDGGFFPAAAIIRRTRRCADDTQPREETPASGLVRPAVPISRMSWPLGA